MGTRADFYIGRGESAEWLGSIAWDGCPDDIPLAVLATTDPDEFRAALTIFLAARDDSTLPEQGWPWPWDDSATTDYAYALDGGKVWASSFGSQWFVATEGEPEEEGKPAVFPNMAERKNVTLGRRSGVILVQG